MQLEPYSLLERASEVRELPSKSERWTRRCRTRRGALYGYAWARWRRGGGGREDEVRALADEGGLTTPTPWRCGCGSVRRRRRRRTVLLRGGESASAQLEEGRGGARRTGKHREADERPRHARPEVADRPIHRHDEHGDAGAAQRPVADERERERESARLMEERNEEDDAPC